jgi:hypothetical protein
VIGAPAAAGWMIRDGEGRERPVVCWTSRGVFALKPDGTSDIARGDVYFDLEAYQNFNAKEVSDAHA